MGISRVTLPAPSARGRTSTGALHCRQKFLRFFPDGFRDETYFEWERGYKWRAHEQWNESLGLTAYKSLLRAGAYSEISARAVRIESRTNLLFSFEKMALRDAVKSSADAERFARGLFEWLHGRGDISKRFSKWCETIAVLPRRQTRVLTWPLVTVFGFLADPETHIFLKPKVTRLAAREYGYELEYNSRPSWEAYAPFLQFAHVVERDLGDLNPKDMIDIQSFLWVQGSDEYEE